MSAEEVFAETVYGLSPELRPTSDVRGGTTEVTAELSNEGDGCSLAELLADVEAHVCRFVAFVSRHQSIAIALWITHVYAIAAAPAAAYLRIKSAAEESGKTTLLEVMQQLLGERCINAISISPSVVFRLRDKVGPVALLLDEVDNTLRGRQDDNARDLLAIANAGYKRGAKVYRSHGKEFEPRAFDAFGPAAIAGIGDLSPTTESRCIPITLTRKPRGSLERFISFQVEGDAHELAGRLTAWASSEVKERLRLAEPAFPGDLRDREVETWWPLLAIADEAGNEWGPLARSAALALHLQRVDESTMGIGVLLLSHSRKVFEAYPEADHLPTVTLLSDLVENEEGPWGKWWGAELNRGGPPRSSAVDLARKLRSFGITPDVHRMRDGTSKRGYSRRDFEEPWTAYLPSPSAVTDVTHVSPLASNVTGDTGDTPTPSRREDDRAEAPAHSRGVITKVWNSGGLWTWAPVHSDESPAWTTLGLHVPWNQHGGLHRTEQEAAEAADRALAGQASFDV